MLSIIAVSNLKKPWSFMHIVWYYDDTSSKLFEQQGGANWWHVGTLCPPPCYSIQKTTSNLKKKIHPPFETYCTFIVRTPVCFFLSAHLLQLKLHKCRVMSPVVNDVARLHVAGPMDFWQNSTTFLSAASFCMTEIGDFGRQPQKWKWPQKWRQHKTSRWTEN